MADLSDIVKSVAPALATALGGPLAGAAVGFISKQFGVPEDQVASVVQGADPVKMKELDLDFQKFCLDNNIKLQLGQLDVNKAEASNTNWFVAGWRPFVGWVCGTGLLYQYLVFPILGKYVAITALDLGTLSQLLFGLLGMAGMRTFEKAKGAEGNR